MIGIRQTVSLAVAYTVFVSVAISIADVNGLVVFGVAFAWFSVGRMVGRNEDVPTRRYRWGRQP